MKSRKPLKNWSAQQVYALEFNLIPLLYQVRWSKLYCKPQSLFRECLFWTPDLLYLSEKSSLSLSKMFCKHYKLFNECSVSEPTGIINKMEITLISQTVFLNREAILPRFIRLLNIPKKWSTVVLSLKGLESLWINGGRMCLQSVG